MPTSRARRARSSRRPHQPPPALQPSRAHHRREATAPSLLRPHRRTPRPARRLRRPSWPAPPPACEGEGRPRRRRRTRASPGRRPLAAARRSGGGEGAREGGAARSSWSLAGATQELGFPLCGCRARSFITFATTLAREDLESCPAGRTCFY
jgi:hypothetical protein